MKQKTLIIILAVALIVALFAVGSLILGRNSDDTITTGPVVEITAVSPTAIPIPTLDPAYATLAGTYRFHADRDAITADYFFTLNPDGTATLTEAPIGNDAPNTTASGQWYVTNGTAVVMEFTHIDGQIVEQDAIVRVTFTDGFPVIDSIEIDGEFVHLENNSFTVGVGDQNDLVDEINRRLSTIPTLNFTPPNSNLYGEPTRQAVVTFQEVNGLVPTGVVDLETWVLLGNPPIVAATPTPQPVVPVTGVPDLSKLPTHDEAGNPILYLTFDDGPQPGSTLALLDVLDQNNAKATFFNVGTNVEAYPDLVREYVSRGHYAANHTWDHTSLEAMTKEQFVDEVGRTNQAIITIAGDLFSLDGNVRYVRPPYGATDDATYTYATQAGMAVTLWTIDPQDWRRPGTEAIANHVVSHAYPGAIVLSHDGGGDRTQTVDAYAIALPQLQAQGYVFYTILGTK